MTLKEHSIEMAIRLIDKESRPRLAKEFGVTEYEFMGRVMDALIAADRDLVSMINRDRGFIDVNSCIPVPSIRLFGARFKRGLSKLGGAQLEI